jgi:hypothetical protein
MCSLGLVNHSFGGLREVGGFRMMTEVKPGHGRNRITACICSAGQQPQNSDAAHRPSFKELFEFHRAVEELISAALRDGLAICPELAGSDLVSRGTGLGLSAADIQDAYRIGRHWRGSKHPQPRLIPSSP